jgi:hypothetical protein
MLLGETNSSMIPNKWCINFRMLRRSAFIFAIAILAQGCAKQRDLVDGYHLALTSNHQAVVIAPGNIAVTKANVTEFAVRDHIITGYTTTQNVDSDTDPVEGFFILDTKSGKFQDGMSEADWRSAMHSLGWPDPVMISTETLR